MVLDNTYALFNTQHKEKSTDVSRFLRIWLGSYSLKSFQLGTAFFFHILSSGS
jgi:hypothetical protein